MRGRFSPLIVFNARLNQPTKCFTDGLCGLSGSKGKKSVCPKENELRDGGQRIKLVHSPVPRPRAGQSQSLCEEPLKNEAGMRNGNSGSRFQLRNETLLQTLEISKIRIRVS
jgi:hypothetical protein